MLFFRKNIGGIWETKKLTPEEAKTIHAKVLKISLSLYRNMLEIAKGAGIDLPPQVAAAIISKAAPSYDSLANDLIEAQLVDGNKSA
jgi:hypothetical protein